LSLEGNLMRKDVILCTICARAGSKGVPHKNTRLLAGTPLVGHAALSATAAGIFSHIVASTDSEEIARIVEGFGAEAFFRRPPELASDGAAKIPVIRHALLESEGHYGVTFSHVIDLDVTCPLRTGSDILEAYRTFRDGGFDNLLSGIASRKSPYFNIVESDAAGRVSLSKKPAAQIVRRQDAPKCFDLNGAVYIWKRDVLLSHDSVITANTGIYVMPEERSVDIDSELDLAFVEFLLERRRLGMNPA
jgi:CMP-N,N'-diacetyllegionaminic acid synthase